jgi:hypothetical protein
MSKDRVEFWCASLRVSYDRGTKRNSPEDLGLDEAPEETADGGLVRGLGSHWKSEEAKARAKVLQGVESKIRREFAKNFQVSLVKGIYSIPRRGAAKELVESGLEVEVPADVGVHVFEFTMGSLDAVAPEELVAWSERAKRQIDGVALGGKKRPTPAGLKALAQLAQCPLFDDATRNEILALVADAKLDAIDRVELKRFLGTIKIGSSVKSTPVAPRRIGKIDLSKSEKNGAKVKPARPRRPKVAKPKKAEAEAKAGSEDAA